MLRKDLEEKLEKLTSNRDRLSADLERKKGRLEEAERRLQELENKCREKKIDPDKLEFVVKDLEGKFEQSLEVLESNLKDLEKKLSGISLE